MIIIGGSSSSGSSLLNQCLGRHRDVAISSETSIFARPQLIEQWDKQKSRLFDNNKLTPLRSYGWHRENGVQWPLQEWNLTLDELNHFVLIAEDYDQFINLLKNAILTKNGKSLWVEKTPANSILFSLLSKLFDTAVLVLTVRDPLEAIASMIIRGFDPLYAACIYLINSSMGLSIQTDKCVVVKYEDFVVNYQKLTKEILDKAGISSGHIDWTAEDEHIKIKSWRYAENELPVLVKHNRFESLAMGQQQFVFSILRSLRIREDFSLFDVKPKFKSIEEIALHLNYKLPLIEIKKELKSTIRMQYICQLASRSLRLDPYNWLNSPFTFV